jgi:heat shock protein HtpX
MYTNIARNKRTTWFLIIVFILIVVALAYLISYLFYPTSSHGGFVITAGAVIGSGLYALLQYFIASRVALAVNGAREVTKADYPEYYRVVENIAITTGLPMPKVYVMDDPSPNAFATGRDPQHAAVCATTGLLGMMDKTELEGVLGHELGHIKNYDIRVSMIVFGLVSAIGLLADIIMRIFLYGGNRERNNNPVFLLIGLAAAILTPIIALLIQLAVSRRREYLADSTSALITRYPEGLISALEKIRDYKGPAKHQDTSTAHLFFTNPLRGKHLLANLFSTHPPIEERIARLRESGQKA